MPIAGKVEMPKQARRPSLSRRTQYEILGGMKDAQQRFEEWRSSQSGRRPIPEALWMLAADLAGQHGVFRAAQVLRLDYTNPTLATNLAFRLIPHWTIP